MQENKYFLHDKNVKLKRQRKMENTCKEYIFSIKETLRNQEDKWKKMLMYRIGFSEQ